MSARPKLPDFARPPLVEVALSAQFEKIEGFRTLHVGLLWTQFRERFPKFEEHPPINPVIEQFGVPASPRGAVNFGLLTSPPLPRCWFLNLAGTELVQVQEDRFVRNWRKKGEGGYPRYKTIRRSFEEDFGTFAGFLREQSLGELKPNQCEVTYVDHVIAGEGWERHGQVEEVITLWAKRKADAFPPEPEEVRFAVSYVIPDNHGNPLGRLHVELQPVFLRMDDKPILVLNFVARGKPKSPGIEGVLSFFDIGHEWIFRAFVSMTSSSMQEIWGRRDG